MIDIDISAIEEKMTDDERQSMKMLRELWGLLAYQVVTEDSEKRQRVELAKYARDILRIEKRIVQRTRGRPFPRYS
jgi:hypothetical protein